MSVRRARNINEWRNMHNKRKKGRGAIMKSVQKERRSTGGREDKSRSFWKTGNEKNKDMENDLIYGGWQREVMKQNVRSKGREVTWVGDDR